MTAPAVPALVTSPAATTLGAVRDRPAVSVPVLIAAFAGAVMVRVAVAGSAGARSVGASLLFAALLVGAAAAGGLRRPPISRRVALVGVGTLAVVVVPALLRVGLHGSLRTTDFPTWALLTTVVAGAEEAFLRGSLYDAVHRRHGVDAAIVVGAVLFALLHLPFYGLGAMPLDLAVGVALGVSRAVAGSWLAPAVAHVGADLAGWWVL